MSFVKVTLPDRAGQTIVRIEANSAKLAMLVPSQVATHIHVPPSKAFGSAETHLARFPMIEERREYRSKRYKSASKRVGIRIEGTGSHVEIV